MADRSHPRDALLDLVGASWLTFAIAAALKLRLFPRLVEPTDPEHLAGEVGADPKRVTRLLRALVAGGVLTEGGDRFRLTEQGELLLDSHPASLAPLFELVGSDWHTMAWATLGDALLTPSTPFAAAHGMDLATHLDENPSHAELLRRGYGSVQSPVGDLNVPDAIAEGVGDIEGQTVVDVGGGDGTVLGKILSRNPLSSGVLLDRPEMADLARVHLRRQGIADRVTVVAGNFFEAVPRGGDIYLLSYVLEDWEDGPAEVILARCRAAMEEGGALLLVEEPRDDEGSTYSRLFDLETMVVQGGEERSLVELERLLASAGFRVTGSVETRVATATLILAAPL